MHQCRSKQDLIHNFLSSHPAPSWILVAWALYMTEYSGTQDGSCLKALDLLKQEFPTGKYKFHLIAFSLYSLSHEYSLSQEDSTEVVVHVITCENTLFLFVLWYFTCTFLKMEWDTYAAAKNVRRIINGLLYKWKNHFSEMKVNV